MVGANLPDVDGIIYFYGDNVDALAFRRGWTHGILAMAVLPVVLAAIMLAFDRFVRRKLRTRRHPTREPARWKPLLILAAITVLSHPLLDFLNTYGVRFLAPFSWKWFYGDALFIIDPWVWATLAIGVSIASYRRRRDRPEPNRPARLALLLVGAYAVSMSLSGVVGRIAADRSFAGSERRMVGPLWMNPFRRQLVLDYGATYRYGSVEFKPWPSTEVARGEDPKRADDPLARVAAATERGQKFLIWSRFPMFRIAREPDGGARVELLDARYPRIHGDWPSTIIRLPASTATLGAVRVEVADLDRRICR